MQSAKWTNSPGMEVNKCRLFSSLVMIEYAGDKRHVYIIERIFFFALDSASGASQTGYFVAWKWTFFHHRTWCCKFYKLGMVVYWFEQNGSANAMENRVIEFVAEIMYLSLRDSTPASIVLHVTYMWKTRRCERDIERNLSQ